MDPQRARACLGVSDDAGWDEVRSAYRRLVRTHHPDRGRTPTEVAARTRRTAEVTAAYASLSAAFGVTAAGSGAANAAPPPAAPVEGDATVLRIALPPPEALAVLLEAAHDLGEVSYLDRANGVLEVIVSDGPGRVSSLLVLTEPDGAGTRAEFGTEPLGVHPAAPPGPLAERMARLLARRSAASRFGR